MTGNDDQPSRPEGARHPAEHVWALAGSIGAVTAVTRFFRALSPDLPVAFVVAVRATAEAAALAAQLLARTTPFVVHSAGLERTLYPRDVLVVPTDGAPLAERSAARPRSACSLHSLDQVLATVAERYRDKAGAIILSGIGPEGAAGCRAIVRYGGRVWTQDSESSQYSTLPRYIRDVCDVGLSAPPEALAERVAKGLTPPPPAGPAFLHDRPPGRPF